MFISTTEVLLDQFQRNILWIVQIWSEFIFGCKRNGSPLNGFSSYVKLFLLLPNIEVGVRGEEYPLKNRGHQSRIFCRHVKHITGIDIVLMKFNEVYALGLSGEIITLQYI